MTAILYLCANHHAGNPAGQKLLTTIGASLPPGFLACHVGVFHGDDRRFGQATVDFLASLGALVSSPRLSEPEVDFDSARLAIEGADLLYLDGGDTVAGIERIRELGLDGAFARAALSARVVFGLSGGACAAGPYTIGYDAQERPRIVPALALGAPLPIDVHDERADWPEMRALLELGPPKKQGLAIPTNGVLVVSPGGQLSSYGKPACELRSLSRDGSWRVAPV